MAPNNLATPDAKAKRYMTCLSELSIANTIAAGIDVIDCPEAIEIIIQSTSRLETIGPAKWATALIVSAHPAPWSIPVPRVQPQNHIQHLVGIWHHLALRPELSPDMPWLDEHMNRLLHPNSNKLPYDLARISLYKRLICLIAARSSYSPPLTFRSLLERKVKEFNTSCMDPSAVPDDTADVLYHLTVLSPESLAHLRRKMARNLEGFQLARYMATHPYLYDTTPESLPSTIEIDASHHTDVNAWYHAGYPTSDLAALAELADSTPAIRAHHEPYHLAPLLSPVARLKWLANPLVANIAPLLFKLPLYDAAQFTSVSFSDWSAALAGAHPSLRQYLIPLAAATRRLAPQPSPASSPPALQSR